MVKIIINDIEVNVPEEFNLLQACEAAGVEIPRFCFHERLSIAGNCRMCLVEIKGGPPAPVASCAMSVKDCVLGARGKVPVILTNSEMVKDARQGVMEFLLINHPLDCPICDQGGECDLQDQAMAYGIDSSSFNEDKRAVEDKYLGPLIKTAMNRCIQCTRCIRFCSEVAGNGELGSIGRGEDMEITTYLEQSLTSELQGNLVDICPVGALLHKHTLFQGRSWEYKKVNSIDAMDAVGSNVRLDSRSGQIMRIIPRVNEDINEEWLADKGRYIVDGLRTQRLDQPFLRKDGKLVAVSWEEALLAVSSRIKATNKSRIGAIVGDMVTCEEVFALKLLMSKLGVENIDCRQDGVMLDPKFGRSSYIFNPQINGIEQADEIVIIGANPRKEAAILNSRIRKTWLAGKCKISVIGNKEELYYNYDYLGNQVNDLESFVSKLTNKNNKRLWLLGQNALIGREGLEILAFVVKKALFLGDIRNDWNGLAILHNAASRVGALDLNFVPSNSGLNAQEMVQAGALDVIYNLGADEITIEDGAFVIYQGSHGDKGAMRADAILPGVAYTEKCGSLVNTEGRVQELQVASSHPVNAKDDWTIIRAVAGSLGIDIGFNSFAELKMLLLKSYPYFSKVGSIEYSDMRKLEDLANLSTNLPKKYKILSSLTNYYLTNPIARSSLVMGECARYHS